MEFFMEFFFSFSGGFLKSRTWFDVLLFSVIFHATSPAIFRKT